MNKAEETRWLVYRPVQDYEVGETPFLVCDTEAKAKEVAYELQDWLEKFALTLPSTDEPNQYLSEDEEVAAYRARNRMLTEATLPYDIKLSLHADISYPYNTVCVGVFAYKSLPYLVTQEIEVLDSLPGSHNARSGGSQ